MLQAALNILVSACALNGLMPNNSFKPTPHRGVGHVLCATLTHVRRPATGRLNSGVMRGLAAACAGSRSCNFITHQAVPRSNTARIGRSSAHAARLSARQRSMQLFSPERARLMTLYAPVSLRSGSAALCASEISHGRELFSARTVIPGSRLFAPTNPRGILTSPG
jgi:hypothetical protein